MTTFIFKVGQVVRIRSTLTTDTHAIEEMLGARGVAIKRYHTAFDNWYHIKVGNRVEPFLEHELDFRFAKR